MRVGQGGEVEAVPGEDARAEVLDEDIGVGHQTPYQLGALRPGEVQRDGGFRAVQRQKVVGGVETVQAAAEVTGAVAVPEPFDLDHRRAEVGELHRRERPGPGMRQVDDPDAVERRRGIRLRGRLRHFWASVKKRSRECIAPRAPSSRRPLK